VFCQEHVVQLRDDRERFEEAGASIVLIGQGGAKGAAKFCAEKEVPFTCLADPRKEAYRAFGLKRGSPREFTGPQMLGRYVKANLRRETRQGSIVGHDVRQMPGTFVVDTGGVVRFAHRNRDSADNPSNQAILSVLQRI
jgi:peroxiredoxin